MDRRAQLAAWVVIVLLGVGAGYVATVVRPFPESEPAWPLRTRYVVERYPSGDDTPEPTVTYHEFEGAGWRDWVDVEWEAADPVEAVVSRFDGRTASGVLGEVRPQEPFATLGRVDRVRWESVEAVHDQRRPPNDWFTFRFGAPPEPAEGRVVMDDVVWRRDEVADELEVDPEALAEAEYVQPTCPELDVEICGTDVYRYRYVYHVAARLPLLIEERKAGIGVTTRLRVSALDLGVTDGVALVAGGASGSADGP